MFDNIMTFAFITTVGQPGQPPKDVYLQFGDIGELQVTQILTPENARDLAKHLKAAADAAEAGKNYVPEV